MLLQDLLGQFDPTLHLNSLPTSPVAAVREDSRLVRPGDLFIARPGTKSDGAQFAADAVARGAIAVIAEKKLGLLPVPQIIIPHAATAASVLAHIFYGQPTEKVKTLAVTGTNGKTTTTYIIRHLLKSVKQRCGMIGTVEIDDGRKRREATMTTPGGCELAELLASMRDKGCWRCAIEVSSHALDQDRIAGMQFAGAGFTNLTRDHLDYHGTMEDYAAAKAKLFSSLDEGAVAALNVGNKWSAWME